MLEKMSRNSSWLKSLESIAMEGAGIAHVLGQHFAENEIKWGIKITRRRRDIGDKGP
jgi:hypothetical protein